MRLVSVYECPGYVQTLYRLLDEREPWQSISHKEMPTMAQHEQFVQSMPYMGWWFIEVEAEFIVGACYITRQREIGVHIFKEFRGSGYATWAVKEVMNKFPGRVLANISPENEPSQELFKSLGFRPIQWTYANE